MFYVLSDIHGNLRRFESIMSQINLQPDDTLYVLGDVVDRYPDGIMILRKIIEMPNARMLLGNHELMMLNAIENDADLRLWYSNGGKVTHESFKQLEKPVQKQILDYVHALPLNMDLTVNNQCYKLVHGAPVEQYGNYQLFYENERDFAVWKRFNTYDCNEEPYTIIFGHTPTKHYSWDRPLKIWHGIGMIGIDCGSGYPQNSGGRLACLRLDDMREFYSEESVD